MSIKVWIDPSLVSLTDNQKVVELEGKTVGQCLEALQARYPTLKSLLFEQGQAWSDVGIFLNNKSAYLSQPVKDGDELTILMPLGGG